MKKNEANIFVFIASIIIGVLISTNIGVTKGNARVFLNAKQYKDALDEKNRLLNDISDIRKQSSEYTKKIDQYKYSDKTQSEITNDFLEEIKQNEMITGTREVKGQGIKVTLNDISTDFDVSSEDENYFERELRLIHYSDMIQIFNDLRNAGAEAISINGLRVTDRTEVYCNGAFLRINGVKIAAPFYISAVGDKEVLYNYMMSNENYLKSLMMRKIDVSVQKTDEVNIPAYNGEMETNYIKNIK